MHPLSITLLVLALAGCQRQAPAQVAAPSADKVDAEAVVLAGDDEIGERLTFSGRVLDYAGRPLSRAAVVAYQADGTGLYNPPDAGTRVPRLRAVAVTNENGGFRFSTIRPASYPDSDEPAHIHLKITAPAHQLRYVTYWFGDDPLVTAEQRRRAGRDAEIVVVAPERDPGGAWTFSHDIRLEGN